MGEGYPAGQAMAAPTLDARATREALLAAGGMAELDAALQRTADILARHFAADVALLHVRRPGTTTFASPSAITIPADSSAWNSTASFEQFDRPLISGPLPPSLVWAGPMASSMRLGLRGERGQLIGFVIIGSIRPAAFGPAELGDLLELGPVLSSWIRPAVLVERLRRQGELMEIEAELLTQAASADTEQALIDAVADGIRRALRADVSFVHVHIANPAFPGATLHCSPRNTLNAAQWSEAHRTMLVPGNAALSEEQQDGSRENPDLLAHAPTPIEVYFRDVVGMRSLLTSVQSHRWGGLGLGLSAARRNPGPYTRAERAFIARLSRVLEIAVERLRRGDLAVEHAVSLERQAELLAVGEEMLATLSDTEDLIAACDRIAERIRTLFEADHVAFGTIDAENLRREWLGISSDVLDRSETSTEIDEADVVAFGRAMNGQLEVVTDLQAQTELNPTTAIMRERGMASFIRAPFRLSDGAVGVVSVASKTKARFGIDDAERLEELCRSMGIAIDRVRLLGRMAESSRMLEVKTRVLASLGPGATIESAGEVFVQEVRRLFGAAHAQVTVGGETSFRIAAISSSHLSPDEMSAALERTSSQAPAGRWELALPYVLPDLTRETRVMHDAELLARGLRCVMRVPLHDERGQLRAIIMAASTEANAWNGDDLAAFTDLSQSLGLVTERAALFAEATERAARVRGLLQMLSTFNPGAQPYEIAASFARQLRDYVAADMVAVDSFVQDSELLLALADTGGFASQDVQRTLKQAIRAMHAPVQGGQLERYSASAPDEAVKWLRKAAEELGLTCAIALRLEVDGPPVGAVVVGARTPGQLGLDAEEMLTAVAGALAMVIERARVVTTLRQQSQRMQAVLDILGALGPRETLEEVAGPIASALRMMYGADHCAIGLVRAGNVTIAGVDSSVVTWSQGDSRSAASVLGTQEPTDAVLHVISDLQEPPDEVSAASRDAGEQGMRSSMRVLIGTPAEPLGVVTVGSRQRARYSETDARQLSQIVQPLGVVMRYFESRSDAARRTNRLETTNRILTRLSAGGTAEHLALGFLKECRQLFEAGHAGVLSFDHESGIGVELAADTDIGAATGAPVAFTLDEMHSARLVREPSPHIVEDARNEPIMHQRHQALIDAGLYSVMRAPLVVQESVRGAVVLWGRGAGQFSLEDAELLGTLTRPLALALEKAAALESLGESELKYRSLVAQAEEMIFLFDSQTHRVLDANTYTARALGYEPGELQRLRFDDIVGEPEEELAQQLARLFADGELRVSDSTYRRRDGSAMMVDVVASLVAYGGRQAVLVLARDVSERKALIGQLIQSQKMDSLGAMAGAVAHDFNNLLTTILGFAGLLKRSRNMDGEERENLALIEDAARRAADLTGRLLSFSRGGLVRFGRVDLRDVVSDTMQLAEPTMHSGIAVTVSMPDGPIYVEGDGGQLQQALTNIVLNARDAMPESGSIEVVLKEEGEVAVVRIADTGPGMDDEVRLRIFEPFYTTKPVGSGTGLGMAITYGIIQGHHGDIAVESAKSRGTTFTISLPVLASSDGPDLGDAYNAGDGNLVLVVDDDAMVRRTTTATLAELGYNVVEAPGGSTAVEIVRARPDRFSAVLLDLVMPGMTGSETFRALTAIRPDLPVVVCTGYAADSHIDTDVKRRIAGLVQKPFTAARLGRALEAAGAKPTGTPRI